MTWKEFVGSANEWDALVLRMGSCHPLNSYHWASQEIPGIRVVRFVFQKDSDASPEAAIQLLKKKLFLSGSYYRSDAGMIGDVSKLAGFLEYLRGIEGNPLYLRLFQRTVRAATEVVVFQEAGLYPTLKPIHSGLSAGIELNSPYHGKYSGNWRHNLSRGSKKGLTVNHSNSCNINELKDIYRDLEKIKGLGSQFSESELIHLTTKFGSHLHVTEVRDDKNQLLSVRAALVLGKMGFDLFAATSEAGRTLYASNLAFHGLLTHCADSGVSFYDCAGIDPRHGKGVMQFKQGAGGQPFEYTGEWDFSPNPLIRRLFNFLLMLKLFLKRK